MKVAKIKIKIEKAAKQASNLTNRDCIHLKLHLLSKPCKLDFLIKIYIKISVICSRAFNKLDFINFFVGNLIKRTQTFVCKNEKNQSKVEFASPHTRCRASKFVSDENRQNFKLSFVRCKRN